MPLKHLHSQCILLALLTSCGDNLHPTTDAAPPDSAPDAPPLLWRDAWGVWADSWCAMAKRCQPDLFASTFVDQADCVTKVIDLNCSVSEHRCSDLYPDDRREVLHQCRLDMDNLGCGIDTAPSTCVAAFQ